MEDTPFSYQILAVIAAIFFFMPFVVLVSKGLIKKHEFFWFALYWMISGIINLLFLSNPFNNSRLMNVIERVYNLSDAPFMLFILYKTVHIDMIEKSIKRMLPAFLFSVLIITIFTRLPEIAETLIVGAGLITILMYITWIIVYYTKGTTYHSTAYTLQFIYYALLFEYGISIVTFIFSYIIPNYSNVNDSFLIYHLSVIVSVSIASYGLIRYKEKTKEKKIIRVKREREAEIKFL